MSLIITPDQIRDSQKTISKNELIRFNKNLIESLQNMSVRAHLLACELQRVDSKNKIFEMKEGVLDKQHLYHIRKALIDGSYDKARDAARLR